MSEDFCVVTRKKWIARKSIPTRARRISERSYDAESAVDIDIESFLKRFQDLCEKMISTDYFLQAIETIDESRCELRLPKETLPPVLLRLACFGIGPFSRNFQALHQLAFIISMQKHYSLKEAIYFDPVFCKSEKEILKRLNCHLMSENCEGKYECNVPTLLFFPHCPNSLTNGLLWRNWSLENLNNIVLINNSFESLKNSKPERFLKADADHILDIFPYTKEFNLENDYETRNVFNDLSVHVFPKAILPATESIFWEKRHEPKYNDIEMITAEDFNKLNLKTEIA